MVKICGAKVHSIRCDIRFFFNESRVFYTFLCTSIAHFHLCFKVSISVETTKRRERVYFFYELGFVIVLVRTRHIMTFASVTNGSRLERNTFLLFFDYRVTPVTNVCMFKFVHRKIICIERCTNRCYE